MTSEAHITLSREAFTCSMLHIPPVYSKSRKIVASNDDIQECVRHQSTLKDKDFIEPVQAQIVRDISLRLESLIGFH